MNLRNRAIGLQDLDSRQFDVCILGTGFAGTAIAGRLACQGARVLLVESGTGMRSWLFDRRMADLAAYEVTGDADYPTTKTKARLLGGNSNFWTGRCERLHPSDFEPHPYTPPDNSWPIGYGDLEPYYEEAEQMLRVRCGPREPGAPPRRRAYPLPPKTDISYLRETFGKAGIEMAESPSATPTRGIRFFSVQREWLPDVVAQPTVALLTGVTATRLIAGRDGAITGAELRTLDGGRGIARARFYVCACGGIENPRLLMLSACEQFPDGIGNHSDKLGRGFNEHPAVNFYSKTRHTPGTLKPTNKMARTHQLYERYRDEGLGSILPVFRQAWILPHHVMPLRLRNLLPMLGSWADRILHPVLYMGATIEMSITESNRVTLSEKRQDAFGNPSAHLHLDFSERDRRLLDRCRALCTDVLQKVGAYDIRESEVTFSRHHQGTCRMGARPESSVVDADCRIHTSPNCYVAGCDTMVTGGAMQPVATLTATALRLADHLQERLVAG